MLKVKYQKKCFEHQAGIAQLGEQQTEVVCSSSRSGGRVFEPPSWHDILLQSLAVV